MTKPNTLNTDAATFNSDASGYLSDNDPYLAVGWQTGFDQVTDDPLTWPVAGKLAAIIGGSVLVVGGATAALVAANPVHVGHASPAA